jgi:hypothetical protein
MDIEQINKIVLNIEHELERIKAALGNVKVGTVRPAALTTVIDDAGERISSMGDMIRDAL